MDVLFDARLLDRAVSGLERVQLNVLRELARRPEISRLRVLLRAGTTPVPAIPPTVEQVFVPDADAILALLEDPATRPDVYHLTWFPDDSPRDLLLPLAAPASVVEVHDAILNRHPEYFPSRERWAWYCRFTKALLRNADRLLIHTESVRGEVTADLDGEAARADLAPLAVAPELVEPLPESEVRQRCADLGCAEPFLLAVGKDYPHKDHATLLRALAQLDPEVSLCIAGSRVWKQPETLDACLRDLGLEDRVRWLEGVGDQDLKALMQGSRALVFPSLEEGFGLPPLEAMALGVPVVAAAAMSIPEVCGDAALLFEPGDVDALLAALRTVLAGGEVVAGLVDKGRARAASFDWQKTAIATVACYERAIAAAAARGDRRPEEIASAVLVAGFPAEAARPRFSLRRRWQKICDGLRRRS